MTKQRTRLSDRLPKYGTQRRNWLTMALTGGVAYNESLKKGQLLFTQKELDSIKERYKEGLTWDDIEGELSKKHIFLKKVTFRKYIKDMQLPRAISYRVTKNGRVAIFPPDTIEHINVIRYFLKVATGNIHDDWFDDLKNERVYLMDAVDSQLSTDPDVVKAIYRYIALGDNDIKSAIEKAFSWRSKDIEEKLLGMLSEIDSKFKKYIVKEVEKFTDYLDEHCMDVEERNGVERYTGPKKIGDAAMKILTEWREKNREKNNESKTLTQETI